MSRLRLLSTIPRPLAVVFGLSAIAIAIGACSGSSSGSDHSGTPTVQATTSASSASGPASNGSSVAAASQGEPLAPIGCVAIPVAQVNALIKTPITTIDYSPKTGGYFPDHRFTCDAGMRIDVYPQDANKSQYTGDVTAENVTPTTIPGVADVAVFTQALENVPDIYAHKGAVTCEIQTSSTVTDYNITVDPKSVFGAGVTKESAAAWAGKAVELCTDIFTALKA